MERYRVGDLILDVERGTLSSARDRIPLSPLTFNLFLALVRRAPDVVRRADLLETVWRGDTVTDAALSQRVNMLRHALGDKSAEPRMIASVRGWGYKLLARVEKLGEADEPIRSIAVVPFESLSRGPAPDRFADAMTDALITSLSRVIPLQVLSRTTSLHYRHVDKPLPAIARELGVQAIVEGAVLRTRGRTWVTVQLVRADTDQHMWAKSYDCKGQIVEVLNGLAGPIANEIGKALGVRSENARVEGSGTEQGAFSGLTPSAYREGRAEP